MRVYNNELGCWQRCTNCTFCERGVAGNFGGHTDGKQYKYYCSDAEAPCVTVVDDPDYECCEEWVVW